MKTQQVIDALQLESHIEGGYFRPTYESPDKITIHSEKGAGERLAVTTIFYMLTKDSPVGHWHKNRSDILHFFQMGSPLTYWILSPEGEIKTHVLGPDLEKGQQLQLLVPGGFWKATTLEAGEYGLLSEAVTPGFVYEDMQLAKEADIRPLVSESLWNKISSFVKTTEDQPG